MRGLSRRRTSVAAVPRIIFLVVAVGAIVPGTAWGLIIGGTGNTPLRRPDWPAGAAAVFDTQARVAYWEGPPFGGGHWHAECRGNAAALSVVLADFAKLEVPNRRIVLHDGVGKSFWLSIAEPGQKPVDARIDWAFHVWVPQNWKRLQGFPPDVRGPDLGPVEQGPPAQLDVYTGGNVKWEDVQVPAGVIVEDQRLAAHGFSVDDGVVLEGQLLSSVTKRPLAGRVVLERLEPGDDGRLHSKVVAEAQAAAEGRWVLTKVPPGPHRLVAEAEGQARRVVGHVAPTDQPSWTSFPCLLAPVAQVTGQVVDEAGKPLTKVNVQLADITAGPDGRYELPATPAVTTDDEGRFRIEGVPQGSARIWVHKSGYCRPGLGLTVKTPAADVAVMMQRAAQVKVRVSFGGTPPPPGYVVKMTPEEGEAPGRWSGSGNIDVNREISFSNVPPGRYVLRGRPNPGGADDETAPRAVDLLGGQTHEIELQAK